MEEVLLYIKINQYLLLIQDSVLKEQSQIKYNIHKNLIHTK